MTDLWFEDFTPGRVFETAGATLTEAAIIDFALVYDPQPFHIDRAAAETSPFGGLIASGFQSLAIVFRMFVMTGALTKASMGGPGMDELRWLLPVRPGDTLRGRFTVASATPSRSKPDRGSAVFLLEGYNQRDELVITAKLTTILRKRPA